MTYYVTSEDHPSSSGKAELIIVRRQDSDLHDEKYRLETRIYLDQVLNPEIQSRLKADIGLNVGTDPDWNALLPLLNDAGRSRAELVWQLQPYPRMLADCERYDMPVAMAEEKLTISEDPKIVVQAACVLLSINPEHASAVKALQSLINHSRQLIHEKAVFALARFGRVEEIQKWLDKSGDDQSWLAMDALGKAALSTNSTNSWAGKHQPQLSQNWQRGHPRLLMHSRTSLNQQKMNPSHRSSFAFR